MKKQNLNYRHAYSGFTLIEVLIAVLILGVSLGASLQAIGNYIRFQTILDERYQAHLIAWNVFIECYAIKRHEDDECESSGFVNHKKTYWDWEAADQEGELVLPLAHNEEIRIPLLLRIVKVYSPDDEGNVIGQLYSIIKN